MEVLRKEREEEPKGLFWIFFFFELVVTLERKEGTSMRRIVTRFFFSREKADIGVFGWKSHSTVVCPFLLRLPTLRDIALSSQVCLLGSFLFSQGTCDSLILLRVRNSPVVAASSATLSQSLLFFTLKC